MTTTRQLNDRCWCFYSSFLHSLLIEGWYKEKLFTIDFPICTVIVKTLTRNGPHLFLTHMTSAQDLHRLNFGMTFTHTHTSECHHYLHLHQQHEHLHHVYIPQHRISIYYQRLSPNYGKTFCNLSHILFRRNSVKTCRVGVHFGIFFSRKKVQRIKSSI